MPHHARKRWSTVHCSLVADNRDNSSSSAQPQAVKGKKQERRRNVLLFFICICREYFLIFLNIRVEAKLSRKLLFSKKKQKQPHKRFWHRTARRSRDAPKASLDSHVRPSFAPFLRHIFYWRKIILVFCGHFRLNQAVQVSLRSRT